jgi:hypothetical protein
MNHGNHNFLEPSGPFQACKGTALPLPLPKDEVHVGRLNSHLLGEVKVNIRKELSVIQK